MPPSQGSVTQLLIKWRDGDETALSQLTPIVYQELRRLAHAYMRRERSGHMLQTSALINEAYIRLVDHRGMRWQNRNHFYAVAAQAMRRVLVDYARSRNDLKHGGGVRMVELDQAVAVAQQQAADLIALDDALTDLAAFDPRKCQVVEMRYFGGMSADEIAEVLGVSVITVNRDWKTAKAWLLRTISPTADERKRPAER
jgi:RNA polymerase sigma-70 factor (ECF subfamily)